MTRYHDPEDDYTSEEDYRPSSQRNCQPNYQRKYVKPAPKSEFTFAKGLAWLLMGALISTFIGNIVELLCKIPVLQDVNAICPNTIQVIDVRKVLAPVLHPLHEVLCGVPVVKDQAWLCPVVEGVKTEDINAEKKNNSSTKEKLNAESGTEKKQPIKENKTEKTSANGKEKAKATEEPDKKERVNENATTKDQTSNNKSSNITTNSTSVDEKKPDQTSKISNTEVKDFLKTLVVQLSHHETNIKKYGSIKNREMLSVQILACSNDLIALGTKLDSWSEEVVGPQGGNVSEFRRLISDVNIGLETTLHAPKKTIEELRRSIETYIPTLESKKEAGDAFSVTFGHLSDLFQQLELQIFEALEAAKLKRANSEIAVLEEALPFPKLAQAILMELHELTHHRTGKIIQWKRTAEEFLEKIKTKKLLEYPLASPFKANLLWKSKSEEKKEEVKVKQVNVQEEKIVVDEKESIEEPTSTSNQKNSTISRVPSSDVFVSSVTSTPNKTSSNPVYFYLEGNLRSYADQTGPFVQRFQDCNLSVKTDITARFYSLTADLAKTANDLHIWESTLLKFHENYAAQFGDPEKKPSDEVFIKTLEETFVLHEAGKALSKKLKEMSEDEKKLSLVLDGELNLAAGKAAESQSLLLRAWAFVALVAFSDDFQLVRDARDVLSENIVLMKAHRDLNSGQYILQLRKQMTQLSKFARDRALDIKYPKIS